jgi:hypothetical protein
VGGRTVGGGCRALGEPRALGERGASEGEVAARDRGGVVVEPLVPAPLAGERAREPGRRQRAGQLADGPRDALTLVVEVPELQVHGAGERQDLGEIRHLRAPEADEQIHVERVHRRRHPARAKQPDDRIVCRRVAPLVAQSGDQLGRHATGLELHQVALRQRRHQDADVDHEAQPRVVELHDGRAGFPVGGRLRGLLPLHLLEEGEPTLVQQRQQTPLQVGTGLADRQAHTGRPDPVRRIDLRHEEVVALLGAPALRGRRPLVEVQPHHGDRPTGCRQVVPQRLHLGGRRLGERAPDLACLEFHRVSDPSPGDVDHDLVRRALGE